MPWRISLRAFAPLPLIVLLALPASAITLIQLSGSGELSIQSSGSITIDTGDNAFSAITLAASRLEIGTGVSLPIPDAVLSLSGLDGYAAGFPEDVSFEILSWSGTLSLSADAIFVTGDLRTLGPDGASRNACEGDGGIVLTSGSTLPNASSCPDLAIAAPTGGGLVVSAGPLVSPGVLIPEPRAALLFAAGVALLSARRSQHH